MSFCKQCILKESNPTIVFNEDGICNVCNKTINLSGNFRSYSDAMRAFNGFKKNVLNGNDSSYDCLLMFSGGKDSIYMLNKLVTEDKLNVLAFSINHPFESSNAINNINKVIEKLNVEHISYTPDLKKYKKLMKYTFLNGKSHTTNRTPCMICTFYMQLNTLLFAYKMNIPYVLYCADPEQITMLTVSIHDIADMIKKICGDEIMEELFGDNLNLFYSDNDSNKMPKLIFPYVEYGNYNKDNIISKLKELELYDNKPSETHCSLRTLLDYYSFINYDCHFYALENATSIRSKEVNRDDEIEFISKYKDIVLNIASKNMITPEEKTYIKSVIEKHGLGPQQQYENTYDNVIRLVESANELGLDLKQMRIKP